MQNLESFPSSSYIKEQHQAYQAFAQSGDFMIQHSMVLSHYIKRLTVRHNISCSRVPHRIFLGSYRLMPVLSCRALARWLI